MYKVGDIIEGKVSGIENYGIFITLENNFSGLIHISEIAHGFIKDINDYVYIDEKIFVHILDIDSSGKNLKLSIKNINYRLNDENIKIKQSKRGFLPLYEKLPDWIKHKLNEIE